MQGLDAKPLQGMRVVLLRDMNTPDELRDRLTALGAEVLVFPTIQIVPFMDARQSLAAEERFASLEFCFLSSGNAAGYFHRWLRERRLDLTGKRVLAIGAHTAQEAERIGLPVSWVASESTVRDATQEALQTFGAELRTGGVYPCSRIASRVAETVLQAQGISLQRLELYDTVDGPARAETLLDALDRSGPMCCLMTSGSTIANFVSRFGESDLQRIAQSIEFLSIGPATTAVAKAQGIAVSAEALAHSSAGLVELVQERSRRRRLQGDDASPC